MDKNEFKKSIRGIKQIGLSSAERDRLWGKIWTRISYGVLPEAKLKEAGPREGIFHVAHLFRQFTILKPGLAYVGAVFLLVVVLGGGISLAAERTVPGDILYAVKVRLNEPVRGAFTFGALKEARWEAVKMERRLKEAEILGARGSLSGQARADIESRLISHQNEFDFLIEKEEAASLSEETLNARLDLEARLNAHARVLGAVEETVATSSGKAELGRLRTVVESKVREFSKERTGHKREIINRSDRKEREKAEEKLFRDKTKSLEDKLRSTLADEKTVRGKDGRIPALQTNILEDAMSALETAQSALKNAREEKAAGETDQAYSSLLESEKSIREAGISLEQSVRLGKERRRAEVGEGGNKEERDEGRSGDPTQGEKDNFGNSDNSIKGVLERGFDKSWRLRDN